MGSRFVISALCVGAVAFACGPRTHNEAAQRQSGTLTLASNSTSPALQQQGTPRATSATTKHEALSATLYVRTNESPIRLAFSVVNTSKKRLELTFPSGQTHDFVIVDSVGREVWRWGTGRMFTQSLRNKLLGGGEALEMVEELPSARLAPGTYTVRATLTSQNYPVTKDASFTLPPTAVATR
jgi:hypothetical protein